MKVPTVAEKIQILQIFIDFMIENDKYFPNLPPHVAMKYINARLNLNKLPPGYIAQIFSATGIEQILKDDYWGMHRSNIEESFELSGDKMIIEPAAGILPILSSQLKNAHPESTFVSIDPLIHQIWAIEHGVIPVKGNFKYPYPFGSRTPDLLMSSYPCGATDEIVKCVVENEQVESYIAMCDCNPLQKFGKNYNDYTRGTIDKIRAGLGDNRCLDLEYHDYGDVTAPIIKVRKIKRPISMPPKWPY